MNVRIVSKNSKSQENITILRLKEKKTAKLIQIKKKKKKKKIFKSEIKPIIENLQDEIYQLQNKQAKRAKLGVTILWLIVARGGIKIKNLEKKCLNLIYLL